MSDNPRNPYPTVDIIIELEGGKIVLIKRKNPPPGWALPGGFVDYAESVESAAIREAMEETCLEIDLIEQFHTYSSPKRDPRQHTLSVVFIARALGQPRAADDAAQIGIVDPHSLPSEMAFDHRQIIADYLSYKETGRKGRFTLPREE